MCKDVRLKEDPSLEKIVANAAGDSTPIQTSSMDKAVKTVSEKTVPCAGDALGKKANQAEIESTEQVTFVLYV